MHRLKILKNNLSWLDFILNLFLAIFIPISTSFQKYKTLEISPLLILEIITTFFALIISFAFLRILFEKISNYKTQRKPQKKLDQFLLKIFDSKKSFLIISLIIFICWIPILITLYPGTLINDSWGQLVQTLALKDGAWILSSHHPVFDTFIMSVIIIPVANVANNWHIGFFVYVIIQAIFTSLTFAYSIIYMKDKFKQSNHISLIFLLIYCFSPIIIASVQTISKDALSAWIYVLFVIEFIEIIRTKNTILKNRKNLITFIVTCILCILTKKIETYVIGGSLILTLIFQKENRKYLIAPLLSITIFAFLITPIIQSVFSIQPSGLQEMFSLPFQQTASYVKEHPNDSTEKEKTVINTVLNYDQLAESYEPSNADFVKGYSQKGETKDYLNYVKVWLQQGFKQPTTYLKAASKHVSGWFSYSMYKPLTNMDHHSQLNPSLIPEDAYQRSNFFSTTTKIFEKTYEFIYKIPVIGTFLTFAFNASIMPAFIICTIFIRRKKFTTKYFLICVPLLLTLIIGCYLAPVSAHLEGMRYLYPVTYTTPLLLMFTLSLYSKKQK